MGTRAGGAGSVTLIAVRDADKLKSFRSYLAGRKKAGVVKLPGGGRLMLLPTAADPRDVSGESIVGLIQQQQRGGGAVLARSPAAAAPPLLPPQQPYSLANSNSSNTPGPPPPRPASSSRNSISISGGGGDSCGGGSGGGGGGEEKEPAASLGGFLGSLMGSMDQTHKSVAGTAAVDRANRAQDQAIKQRVSNFEAEVREKIAVFSTNPEAISHTFPHVEKTLRSIQHSLAEDFDGITTRTEGELDDRRVVLYKLGYEPPEEEVQVDAQVHLGLARNALSSASSVSAAPMPALGGSAGGGTNAGGGGDVGSADLVRIGTVVKDRRTVQDIEEESRKRRRRC
ncbi:unnamed protein product [Ectocarpus sp. 4 AP-2014]